MSGQMIAKCPVLKKAEDRRVERSVEGLFDELTAAGVVLTVAGERLQVRAPKGALPEELRTAMAAQKDRLLRLVTSRYRGAERCVRAERRNLPCRHMTRCAEPVNDLPCKVDPVCCLCGTPFTPGRRYLCERCTAEQQAKIDRDRAAQDARLETAS